MFDIDATGSCKSDVTFYLRVDCQPLVALDGQMSRCDEIGREIKVF